MLITERGTAIVCEMSFLFYEFGLWKYMKYNGQRALSQCELVKSHHF